MRCVECGKEVEEYHFITNVCEKCSVGETKQSNDGGKE